MTTTLYDINRYESPVKNWWASLVLGIIFIAVSLLVFMNPGESYLALSVIYGVMVVISGIMEIYLGINTPAQSGRGWLIAAGIIELLLGVLLFAMPAVMISILPFVLGFWLMFRGFMTIGVASDMIGDGIKGAGWTLAFAIVAVICSFLILANPVLGVGAIVIWLGISLLLSGITLIVFAFHLYSLRKNLK